MIAAIRRGLGNFNAVYLRVLAHSIPLMKLPAFDPPGFLQDYKNIPGQLEQWSKAISGWMDEAIRSELQAFAGQFDPKAKGNKCQYFNASETDPGGSPINQAIVWNAFPRTLELGY